MELRKDYYHDRWVIVGTGRSKRPHEFKEPIAQETSATDFFAPGNEHLTPPEIGRHGNPWRLRWFANKFPFLADESKASVSTLLLKSMSARGYHEIIVETRTKKQLWDMTERDFRDLLKVYRLRIESLERKPGVKYVQIFKNHGKKAGTSILHSHSQVAATPLVPPNVIAETKIAKKYGKDCYKKIIAKEKYGPRVCFQTRKVIAIAPYASRFNFEAWIFPKRYARSLSDLTLIEMKDLAACMRHLLRRLRSLNIPYNMFLHYAPRGQELHMHIGITPRRQTWAGFEISSGIIINEVLPEDAAKFYRK